MKKSELFPPPCLGLHNLESQPVPLNANAIDGPVTDPTLLDQAPPLKHLLTKYGLEAKDPDEIKQAKY